MLKVGIPNMNVSCVSGKSSYLVLLASEIYVNIILEMLRGNVLKYIAMHIIGIVTWSISFLCDCG